MSFDLGDYVEVKDRLVEARDKFPEHRFQSEFSVHETQEGTFVAVLTRFYRDADDTCPAVGLAWEPVPGKTPYTLDSELMNAETSAWGRALIAAGVADAHGGVASANEVRNRQYTSHSDEPARGKYNCPACGSQVYDNRRENAGTKKPLWKCSNRNCTGGKGNYSWASWEEDPGDAGLIGPAPVREDFEASVPMPEPRHEWDEMEAPF